MVFSLEERGFSIVDTNVPLELRSALRFIFEEKTCPNPGRDDKVDELSTGSTGRRRGGAQSSQRRYRRGTTGGGQVRSRARDDAADEMSRSGTATTRQK